MDLNRRIFGTRRTGFSEHIVSRFSLTERVIFYICAITITISSIVLLWGVNNNFLVPVPARGGTLVEGIVGYPRFINPILYYSSAGDDLEKLIYSGLVKSMPDGTLVPDLAKSYDISEDELTYTFVLKDNVKFHDGEPVTAEDVEFTIKRAADPGIKSPERVKWEGVNVEIVDPKTIRFTLKNPYTPFLENATLGILPKHIWKNADIEQFTFSKFNAEPIGTGPYFIDIIKRDVEGIPRYYELRSFKDYALGEPMIEKIVVKFYPTETAVIEAYNKGEVESINAVSGKNVADFASVNGEVNKTPLPRVFGVFFNQNQQKILSNKEVREALRMSVNKKEIIDTVLHGYGTRIAGPLPPGFPLVTDDDEDRAEADIDGARELLSSNGWTLDENGFFEKKSKTDSTALKFTISTSDTPELSATANLLKEQWRKIGADVDVKVFESGDFNQSVLRPRKYDALLFGEIIGRDLDLYAFWHSGERNDPGLNIAMYANTSVDKALSSIRSTSLADERAEQLLIIQKEIKEDIPAIFIYSPDYIYVLPKKIKNFKMGKLMGPSERFASVSDWYINEDKVWNIFAK
ncbi:MAG: hypothetical protein A3G52_00175 [Candidatus Taylorbacteria bacterium RIFCSPLOWO2_12_FULL_43_20]|uniref:Solute-binding protein family 5 domain-containing protein n=1 Tax=Candidatus Taylorbacteria bacterium RIFCSPLOWO2_12_FULL_43_20 TaxID=1802332 RepID=A0A1G2P1G1_9BACT|nr:MAG: hypothetical protein A2825_01570 [Candidatus Taylorbacteria bacterium RIFCSPHIGHO2_01_FULL_43_120]OHA23116.1 MAG: hypothetical protein A3B98_03635 [Candidatus Taylorbacteria bacterium RIFCSPHIGHO2_02_FULL_43_55]OHA28903.1 MAG: hypothetical protein A3E92_04495 [Candidatus Taylorbacteria bacterium RIFCSPHIGHO2_12_FULL_42_34]OHA30887.1 MAG: hypothetical protein A3B09_04445 [Candidatus Taylorbacteria bacterium RIFCSPLOWO2_01_FULL_43_83]OHA39319.1 MAG: hypothetical protein A3H58_04015 [Candi